MAYRKFEDALSDLKRCVDEYKPKKLEERSLVFLAATKAFEVCLEYGWKELKRLVEESGLEAQSPKDAIRVAAQINILKDPELWIDAINARNLSVHDYFSLPEKDFMELVTKFYKSAEALKKTLT